MESFFLLNQLENNLDDNSIILLTLLQLQRKPLAGLMSITF